jgi:Icc-related predicted phosphoesterase
MLGAELGKIVVVSDIHYEQNTFHGIDESRAFDWLLYLLLELSPTDLIGLGDWGYAWTIQRWEEITSIVKVHTIFGNHDDLEVLNQIKNINNSRILTRDAEVRNINGFNFGFINGIVTEDGGIKKGNPRKTPDQYLAMAKKLPSIDFLCTHESPLMPNPCDKPNGIGSMTAKMALDISRPIISLSGHLHGAVVFKQIGKTVAIRIDSSQAQRQYIVVETQNREIEIWGEYHLIQRFCPFSPLL